RHEAHVRAGGPTGAAQHPAGAYRGSRGGGEPLCLSRVAARALRERHDDRDRRRPAETAHGRGTRLMRLAELAAWRGGVVRSNSDREAASPPLVLHSRLTPPRQAAIPRASSAADVAQRVAETS